MSNHTPEPWQLKDSWEGVIPVDRTGEYDTIFYQVGNYDTPACSKEDGERIVACVNACVGMEDPEKEIAILRLKNKTSLANNLCPDCRDKQTFKSCLSCENQKLRSDKQTLVDALEEAIEGMEDMIGYVPDYFREKWKHDDCIKEAREALASVREKEEG